jgi:competence protein ComGB
MISQALRHLKLPQIVQNQLMIAQINGGLQQTLEQCGNILKSKAKQHAKLRELLAYPIFILGFLVLMMVGMKVYILPQLGTTESGGQLDLFTKIGGLILVVTSIIAGIFMVKVKHQNEYQRAQTLIKLPLLSESYLNFYQYSILQSWGMQFSKGMDLQKICQNNQEFPQGSIQNVLATNLLNSLVKGISFQDVIEQEKLLPNELKLIFYLGAGGEEMATDILLIAELKYQQTQASIKKLLRLVQPILFGVIAVFILIAYLMILLPVYGMMKGLN